MFDEIDEFDEYLHSENFIINILYQEWYHFLQQFYDINDLLLVVDEVVDVIFLELDEVVEVVDEIDDV